MSSGVVGTRKGQWWAWLAVAPLAGWALVRATSLYLGHPFVQVLAFTPYAAVAALFLLGALLGARQWAPAVGAALAVLLFAGCVLPRALRSPPSDEYQPRLTVMSMNMWGGAADPNQIVGLVRDRGVDVLAVQEFTPEAERSLASAGLRDLLPYGQLNPTPGAGGSAVYSRHPISDGQVSQNPGGFLQSSAVVRIDRYGAEPVRVVSVHPVPPNSAAWVPLWSQDLRAQLSARPQPRPLVLAGDFNATLDHPQLRALMDTGYYDAAVEVGQGLIPTWPYAGRRAAVTPKVTIDHILVSESILVRGFAATTVDVTDHRAIVATLVLGVRAETLSSPISTTTSAS